jgi:hypothetical protein
MLGVDCIEHCSCLTEKGSVLSRNLWPALSIGDIAISGVLTPIRKSISAKLRQLSES